MKHEIKSLEQIKVGSIIYQHFRDAYCIVTKIDSIMIYFYDTDTQFKRRRLASIEEFDEEFAIVSL